MQFSLLQTFSTYFSDFIYSLYYRVLQKKHHLLVSVFPGTVCMLIKLENFFTGIAMVLILILCGTSKKIYFRLDKTMKPLVPCLRKLLHLSHMVKLISNMIHNPSLEKGLVWFHTDRWGVFWNFKKFLTHW